MVRFVVLNNKFGTEVTLCSIGASIYDIKTKDKNGVLGSILYTPKNMADFPYDNSYFGKTIGRTGGRISRSRFILDNEEYEIPSNDPNGLHGGSDGLSFKSFDYVENNTDEYSEIIFSYLSPDMESGYPGNLKLNVIYRLYKLENKLTLRYEAKADKKTILNLSNHAYFNLSGDAKNNVLNHDLYIGASKMEKIVNLIPSEIVDCDEIYSFKNKHKIGKYLMDEEIINNTNGYDYPYIFDSCNKNIDNIILEDEESRRRLKVRTSYPVVVVYTCNYVGDETMNNNKIAEAYNAVCLECMYHPNTINSKFLTDKKDILDKDDTYDEMIEYYFEVIE